MIRRALLSVSDKTGLLPFARALAARGVEILSTGGTLKALLAEGVPARSVEEYTGSPEVMGGRVKTLHPRVHGGLLARTGIDDADLERIGAKPIDLVVVNLYPFAETVAKPDVQRAEAIENIDIGGPSMLRSAAKNHERVTVVCDPRDYHAVLGEMGDGVSVSLATRQRLAAKAYSHTAAYDGVIAATLSSPSDASKHSIAFPEHLTMTLERRDVLRYGENPH